MVGEALEVYQTLDLSLPPLPPRSRLYRLQPVGMGTPLVESLSSYLSRLARAHLVSVTVLARQEIAPLFQTYRSDHAVSALFSWGAYGCNGAGLRAVDTVLALEQLTRRSDLRFCTMYSWQQVFHPKGQLHRQQFWCPACYEQWQQAGQELYNPLLWALEGVTVCPEHRRILSRNCPACQRPVPVITGRIGYCPGCGAWLGQPRDEPDLSQAEGGQALWQAQALGELLAAAPQLEQLPTREQLIRGLTDYVQQATGGNQTALVRLRGLSFHQLRTCLRKDRRPQLKHFVALCYRLAVQPLQFFAEPGRPLILPELNWLEESQAEPIPTVVMGPVEPLEDEVRQALLAIIASSETPTLKEVARRLGRTSNALRYGYAELCRLIVQQHQAARREQKQQLQHELTQILIGAESPPPSLVEVANRLSTNPGQLRDWFPDLCRTIVDRHRSYEPPEKQVARQALERILASSENPPPLTEIARRLNYSDSALRRHFPELRQAINRQRELYRTAEKQRVQQELEAVLGASQAPPSLVQLEQRLACDKSTLRLWFPDLCQAIVERRQTFRLPSRALHSQQNRRQPPPPAELKPPPEPNRKIDSFEKERLALRTELEALLAQPEEPPPSLAEVGRRLGYNAYGLRSRCPELCDQVIERRRAYGRQERAKIRGQLEAHLANEERPPSLNALASQLNYPSSQLQHYFPDLCQALVERRQALDQAEKERLQLELHACLTSSEWPPPSLRRVTHRLGHPGSTLTDWFPRECQVIRERHSRYHQARQEKARQDLAGLLVSPETPPPSLHAISLRFDYPEKWLRRHFPDLCQALTDRRQNYDEAEKSNRQLALEAILTSEAGPPLSLEAACRQVGCSSQSVRRFFPDLARRISHRYATYRAEQKQQTITKLTAQIQEVVHQLYRDGVYPSFKQVAARLPNLGAIRRAEGLAAWRETLRELDLLN